LVSTNAQVDFTLGSSLTVGGQLEIQSGARLRLDSNSPARDLTLAAGSSLSGAGVILFEGSNHLLLLADVSIGTGLVDFTGASTIAGTNILTIAGGSTVRFDHTAITAGSVTVDGALTIVGSPVTLTISRTLTLDSIGILNNSDTVHVGAFVNKGGVINGSAPVVIGPTVQPLPIDRIQILHVASGGQSASPAVTAPGTVVLTWRAQPGTRFIIESTAGLETWVQKPATVREISPGVFQGSIILSNAKARFYRLQVLPIGAQAPHSPD
jgi:hypothetical protein